MEILISGYIVRDADNIFFLNTFLLFFKCFKTFAKCYLKLCITSIIKIVKKNLKFDDTIAYKYKE